MSFAHQTHGISAITHNRTIQIRVFEIRSSTDPCHEALRDFFGESWFARNTKHAPASSSRNLPPRSLPPSSNTRRATLNTVTRDPRILGSIQAIIRHSRSTSHNLVNSNDYRSSRPMNHWFLSWRPNFMVHCLKFNFMTGDYHKFELQFLFCLEWCERRIVPS